jgi:nitrous oxide reductase accessory protein NosL
MKRAIVLVVAASVLVGACRSGASEACLTPARVSAEVAKIDTYSLYDPQRPQTLERLTPDQVTAVTDVERKACA